MKKFKLALKIFLACILLIILVLAVYVAYVFISYSRIEDNLQLEVAVEESLDGKFVSVDKEYTVVSQNLGFGAYTADFTFFMDGGKESRARSAESVKSCITKGAETVAGFAPDFILFQEVDLDSTRSHHIDQLAMLDDLFCGYSYASAINYDSAYLFYPIFSPHGASKSSIATFSNVNITSSLRRSLPISDGISKILDLDRCYSVSRVPVENGKELILYNVHTSAYGSDDSIRTAQLTMLFDDMKAEYEKGNYIVCGGDFNHDFTGDSSLKLNGDNSDYGWAQPFPDELIPEGFSKCDSYDSDLLLPSCRNCDIPYKKGNYTIIVDGFFVSDNIECTFVENVQTEFEYSDHTPVVMKFKLK